MSREVLTAVVIYGLFGLVIWRALYGVDAAAAKRYLVLIPLQMAAFLVVVRVMWGVLPLFLILLVAVLMVVNGLAARFCSQCGALRRRGMLSTRECRRCGGTTFVPLWTALRFPS